MFKSCEECTMKCCKMGEGPYEPVTFHKWYYGSKPHERYNRVCENFDLDTEKCKVWGTEEFPIECEIYVCSNRVFSEEELEYIRKRTEDYYKGLK